MTREPYAYLLLELSLVTVFVVTALAVLRSHTGTQLWFLGPVILAAGAVLPTVLRGATLSSLGLQKGRLRPNVRSVCVGGAALLALGLGGLAVLRGMDAKPPVSVQIPARRQILWVLFQFLYAALPEELFFRGYVQGSVARLLERGIRQSPSFVRNSAIGLSAGIFGLSHVLVFGDLAAVLTFLPGLIFAWVYATTKSLIGPVLLHGAANVGYALLVYGLS